MSRIGSAPITIPTGVEVLKTGKTMSVTGPKGNLKIDTNPAIEVEVEGNQVIVKRKNDQKKVKALHGLTRSLIANMIAGVNTLWSKNLEFLICCACRRNLKAGQKRKNNQKNGDIYGYLVNRKFRQFYV